MLWLRSKKNRRQALTLIRLSKSTDKTVVPVIFQSDVAKLFFAYLVTYTGSAMAPIAVAFGVLELTGSAKDAAIVIAAPTLAAIAVILFGGVIADRTSRKYVLVIAEVLSMLSQLAIGLLFIFGEPTVPVLTGLMLINGIAMAFNAPAATGLVVQIVEKHELQDANVMLGTARNGAIAGGAALGGLLVATFGAGLTLIIDAMTFGISAFLIGTLNVKVHAAIEPASMFEDLRLGWWEFTSHTWLWTIVMQFSLIVAAIESTFGLLGPAIAKDMLGGAISWGNIAASFGVGTLLGGLIAFKIRPKHPMFVGSLLVFVFATVPLSLSVPLAVPIIAVMAFAAGVAGQIFSVLWYTTLQQQVPAHLLSRVSAYDHLGSIVLAPLGIVIAGMLYEWVGYELTMYMVAATIILPTAAVLCVKDVRSMSNVALD